MEFDPTQATTDTLETELIRLERLIRRARRLQAALVAEADRRQLPTADGARTIIDWVAAKLDVTHTTARQIHTLTHTHLTDPDLSTDRTIALTRLSDAIGTPVEPQDWAGFDLPALHRRIHHHRHATRRLEYDAVEDRFVAIQPNLDSSSWRLWGQLPATDGAVVEQALTSRGDQLVAGLPPDEPRPNRGQSTADALVSIAIDSFDTGESSGTATVTIVCDARTAAPKNGHTGVTIVGGDPESAPTPWKRSCVTAPSKSSPSPPTAPPWVSATPPPPSPHVSAAPSSPATGPAPSTPAPPATDSNLTTSTTTPGAATTTPPTPIAISRQRSAISHGLGHTIDPTSPPQRRRLTPPASSPDPPP